MDKVFMALAMLAVMGVVASLGIGMVSMAKGTAKAHQLSQKMMRMRIVCQALAVGCLLLAYLAKN